VAEPLQVLEQQVLAVQRLVLHSSRRRSQY